MVSNRSKLSSHLLSGYDASQPPDLEGLSVDVQLALLNLVDISTAQENIQLHAWYVPMLRIHASSMGVGMCTDGMLHALAHVAYHLGSYASCAAVGAELLLSIALACRWRMYWKDPGLTWDMNEWGVKHLTFKFSQIWSPDIIIFEQIKQEESAQVLSTVYPDGSVFVSHPRVITVGCNMNLVRSLVSNPPS